MLILGMSGGCNRLGRPPFAPLPPHAFHDAAAVLLCDGEVLVAIEEERLDRLKHTNHAPFSAIRACLDVAGVTMADVDRVVYYEHELVCSSVLREGFVELREMPTLYDARGFIGELFASEFGEDVRERVRFVHHHVAHAMAALGQSGFERALVLTLDGSGDFDSATVFTAEGSRLTRLSSYSDDPRYSIGRLYEKLCRYLGFTYFDEYKVMGLAPYGDPAALRGVFQQFYTLEPDGAWALHPERFALLFEVMRPRRRREPIERIHQDIAAALQETVEALVMHVLEHHRRATGLSRLCLGGGVALNCTMNGKIARSGLFDEVFVHPASNDAGCALGAALAVHFAEDQAARPARVEHVYWGRPVTDDVEGRLRAWSDLVEFERCDDICSRAAELMAGGSVIGWVQGRSEFGPRALGNRSILADPRPAANKQVVNEMVKKRESFRPFAPAVLEEHVHEYFEIDPGTKLPFMLFVVGVRERHRATLGAVTHVDGSARVQTVSRATNPRFWRLIDAFRERTGVPVLLNTSFNNNAEPIVDSVDDAVACFVTTGLHYLVIGDHLARKRRSPLEGMLSLCPDLPNYARLERCTRRTSDGLSTEHRLTNIAPYDHVMAHWSGAVATLDEAIYGVLQRADGSRPLGELIAASSSPGPGSAPDEVVRSLWELWTRRLVTMTPRSCARA